MIGEICPLQSLRGNEVYCDKGLCAWYDRDSEKCAVASLPAALDVLTRFCLTDSYPPPTDHNKLRDGL